MEGQMDLDTVTLSRCSPLQMIVLTLAAFTEGTPRAWRPSSARDDALAEGLCRIGLLDRSYHLTDLGWQVYRGRQGAWAHRSALA
jgi:hypothetical protein